MKRNETICSLSSSKFKFSLPTTTPRQKLTLALFPLRLETYLSMHAFLHDVFLSYKQTFIYIIQPSIVHT